ncbi:hypothetical protein SVAN01_10836 [Stagonosporopsis vannaccii]|nr:hypothetical protein SVAN01_10836 [Stagonosporopsis vannaccii]
MPHQGARVKPTPYPFLLFHSLRSFQLISSLVVAVIMSYFLRELSANNYSLPWTFILLLAVSLLTLLSLTWTIVLHIRHGLNPSLNLCLNGVLAALWAVSFALLSWWSASTLSSACAVKNWESDVGTSVCRTYKALFSFALLGLLGTMASLGLDVHVLRAATGRGRFISLKMGGGKREGDDGVDEGIWDSNPNPAALRGVQRGGDGYALPEEQFGYADTGYAGAGGQMGRRSVEERL